MKFLGKIFRVQSDSVGCLTNNHPVNHGYYHVYLYVFSENGQLLQNELARLGLMKLASRVVVDTVPFSPFIGDVARYNAINKALKMDYTTRK